MTGWQDLAAGLADHLAGLGVLGDWWREAFEQLPRHVFLPDQPWQVAYADEAVTIQQRPAEVVGGQSVAMATSSASRPAVVAVMLDRLGVCAGMRVLEIGTGTGYNAGLLCHRLGDDNVVSVDIDPTLVDHAGTALSGLGYQPTLLAGDGQFGAPDQAPYDAIIATCAATCLPPAWIEQLRPGGRLVAPLYGSGQALMVLTKTADDEVTGRLDSYPAGFMPMRTQVDNPLAPGHVLGFDGPGIPHGGTTRLDPHLVADADLDLLLFLQLHLPGVQVGTADRDNGATVVVTVPGSYAEVTLTETTPRRWPTAQHGHQRVWDTIEHALPRWQELGRPPRNRFGVTALDEPGRQYVWLDDPDGTDYWPMLA